MKYCPSKTPVQTPPPRIRDTVMVMGGRGSCQQGLLPGGLSAIRPDIRHAVITRKSKNLNEIERRAAQRTCEPNLTHYSLSRRHNLLVILSCS